MDAEIGTPCLNGIVFIIDRFFSAACAPVGMGILFDFWCPVGVVIQNIL